MSTSTIGYLEGEKYIKTPVDAGLDAMGNAAGGALCVYIIAWFVGHRKTKAQKPTSPDTK
jgi:hypothetical protein